MIVKFPESCFLYSLRNCEPIKPLFFMSYRVSGNYLQQCKNELTKKIDTKEWDIAIKIPENVEATLEQAEVGRV